jgi:hypothetical protein
MSDLVKCPMCRGNTKWGNTCNFCWGLVWISEEDMFSLLLDYLDDKEAFKDPIGSRPKIMVGFKHAPAPELFDPEDSNAT